MDIGTVILSQTKKVTLMLTKACTKVREKGQQSLVCQGFWRLCACMCVYIMCLPAFIVWMNYCTSCWERQYLSTSDWDTRKKGTITEIEDIFSQSGTFISDKKCYRMISYNNTEAVTFLNLIVLHLKDLCFYTSSFLSFFRGMAWENPCWEISREITTGQKYRQ